MIVNLQWNETEFQFRCKVKALFPITKILKRISHDLMQVQKDYQRKLIKFEFPFSGKYESYVSQYETTIKPINGNKYDMLTNKNLGYISISSMII